MLNIGGGELLIILLVALVVLGPTRLPQVARQVGQTVTTLRSLATGFQSEVAAAARVDPVPSPAPDDGPTDPVLKAIDAAFTPVIVPKTVPKPQTQTVPKSDPLEVARAARSSGVQQDSAERSTALRNVSDGGPKDLRDEEE